LEREITPFLSPNARSEINYFFDNFYATPDTPWTAEDRNISRTLAGYLVNFVTNLDPNGPGLAHWEQAGKKPVTMLLADDVYRSGYPIGKAERIQFFIKFFCTQATF
jgi:para-nitrobenzyl esterase